MSQSLKCIFVLFLLDVLLLSNCKKNADNPVPIPEAPVILSSPPDTVLTEKGIDAIPDNNAIQIQWELDSIFNGYRLYKKSQKDEIFSLAADLGEADSLYIDEKNVVFNVRYFYFIKGVDENGTWSESSDTVNYMLIAKAFNLLVSSEEHLLFHWQFYDYSPEMYILKLFDAQDDNLIWMSEIMPSYETLDEQAQFNWDGKAKIRQLVPGKAYQWRVDIRGPSLNSGSESHWQKFVLQ